MELLEKILAEYQDYSEKELEKIYKTSKIINVYEIFDSITGGIFISDKDTVLLKGSMHPVFEVFDIDCIEKNRQYTCNFNNKVVLRGPKNYYFGFSFLGDLDVKREEIINSIKGVNTFLKRTEKYPNYNLKYENIMDLKYILAVLDIIRNSILTNLFFYLMKKDNIEDIYIYNDGYNHLANEFYKLLLKVEEKFVDIFLNQKQELKFGVIELIKNTINIQEQMIEDLMSNPSQYKDDLYIRYRKLREADNVFENILSINYAIDNIIQERKSLIHDNFIYLFGLNYGSLELTAIANILFKENGIEVKVGNIMKKFRKVYVEATNKQDNILNEKLNKDGYYIIIDENIMTGDTLIKSNDYLKDKGLNLLDYIVIKYPTISRVKNLNDVNINEYTKILKRIKGMLIPSNYSKMCEYRSDFVFPYMDKLGTFDLSKYEILKNLYKNGIYIKGSAVDRLEQYYKEVFF